MASRDGARPPSAYARYAIWLAAAIFAALHLLHNGIDPFSIGSIIVLILFGFALQYVEKTRRPLKNYLRVALGAAALALVLIGMPLRMGTQIWIGLILWVGLVGAMLAWVHFYERTELL